MPLNSVLHTSARRSWEGSPLPNVLHWLISAVVMVLVGILLGVVVRVFNDIQVMFMEDGPVESLQAAVLAATAGIFAFAFLRSTGARAVFCVIATFVIVMAITRELPRCGSAFTGGGLCLTTGWKRTVLLTAGASALIALFWRRQEWSAEVFRFSNLRWVWPCAVIVLVLAGAEAAEHFMYVEIEESLELVSYLYLFAFGLWVLRSSGTRDPESL